LTIPGVELLHLHLGEYEGIARDAVIGYDLLQRYVIRVDYDTKTMSFYDPVSFRYAGKGHVTPITIWSNCALVGADLTLLDSQRLHGSFMVDTGADLPILINTPFVERHDLMHQVGKTAQGSLTGSDGAEVTTYRGKTQKVDVAGFTFPNCPVRLADADSGTLSLSEIEGILGGPILRKFNTTFDYHGRKMYWEPTRSFSPDLR
jgi:hypothetical protein